MANPDRKASPEDLLEFGDHELSGAPSIAALIAVLPETEREAYREQRRAFLRSLGFKGTWREYLTMAESEALYERIEKKIT